MRKKRNLLTLVNIALLVGLVGSSAYVARDVFSMINRNSNTEIDLPKSPDLASNKNTIKSFASKIVPAPASKAAPVKPRNKKNKRGKKQKKLELIGILAYSQKPDSSMALFSVEGGQDTAVKVGDDIDSGRILESIEADGAVIEQNGSLKKKTLLEKYKGSNRGAMNRGGRVMDPFQDEMNRRADMMRMKQERREEMGMEDPMLAPEELMGMPGMEGMEDPSMFPSPMEPGVVPGGQGAY